MPEFLLIVSLAIGAARSAFGDFVNAYLPFGTVILISVNIAISLVPISLLFAAIYEVALMV